MIQAVLVVVLAVLAGTLLGLVPDRRAGLLGPIRTFALTAALGVVCFHLFPEAFAALGVWALLGLLAGLAGPDLLGRLGAFVWKARGGGDRTSELTLEASYFGLLLHHLGDGVALGAYTGDLHAGHSHGDVMAAIAAHAVPVVAIMVLAFDAVRGRGSALFRALGLALASIAGILFAGSVPAAFAETWGGWIAAIVSGLLIHVVTHDLSAQAPSTPRARSLDLVVAAAGFATSLIGGSAHHEEPGAHAHAHLHIPDALLDISLQVAPLLLLGLASAALLHASGTKIPSLADSPGRSLGSRFWRAFDELFHQIGAFTVVGIVAAALLQTLLPADALTSGRWLDSSMMSAVAIPSALCTVVTLAFLRHRLGWRATRWRGTLSAAVGVLCATWVLALLINPWGAQHGAPARWVVGLGLVCGLLLLRSIWRSGLRGWLATLRPEPSPGGHGHAHGHAPGHRQAPAHDLPVSG